jgi:hypothetical protein
LNLAIARREIQAFERDEVMADIDRLMEEGFFRLVQVSQTAIYAKAEELSDRHTSTVSSRSLDLMNVAAAILSKARLFLSTDARQRLVEEAERLAVKP